jgi:hypothetical protein
MSTSPAGPSNFDLSMEGPPPPTAPDVETSGDQRVSDEIERWRAGAETRTLGSLIELFGEKAFAVMFVFLLGVPALPLPTAGATHVLEVIAALLALQLIVGRDDVWLPERWKRIELDGPKQKRFVNGLVKMIRWLERFTRPRLRRLFDHRVSNSVFGLLVLLLSVGAFVAPPFTGLDTLPALGAVILSLAVLMEDFALVFAGLAIGVAGVALEFVLGRAALSGVQQLFSVVWPPG